MQLLACQVAVTVSASGLSGCVPCHVETGGVGRTLLPPFVWRIKGPIGIAVILLLLLPLLLPQLILQLRHLLPKGLFFDNNFVLDVFVYVLLHVHLCQD